MKTDATPYAEALLQAAKRSDWPRLADQLDALAELLSRNALAGQLLADAAARPAADRLKLVKAVLKGFLPALQQLVARLVADGALDAVPELRDAFRRGYNRRAGLTPVRVETAEPLTAATRKRLVAQLTASGRKPALTEALQPTLIGGLRLVVDDVEYDFSIGGALDRLEQSVRNA